MQEVFLPTLVHTNLIKIAPLTFTDMSRRHGRYEETLLRIMKI